MRVSRTTALVAAVTATLLVGAGVAGTAAFAEDDDAPVAAPAQPGDEATGPAETSEPTESAEPAPTTGKDGKGKGRKGKKTPGETSLASVLAADTDGFDEDAEDYDIVTAAVTAVLKAKPTSAVAVLADGKTPLTAFLPNDGAFRQLVKDISGKTVASEADVFAAVAGLGIPTVETVLLYHVVPGATITAKQALKADGVKLKTAQGGTITVGVGEYDDRPLVQLADQDADDVDPYVVDFDINKGNKQIAHGISRVLRPVDLP